MIETTERLPGARIASPPTESELLNIPEFIRERQQTITGALIDQFQPAIEQASDSELDRLCHTIDVLRLQRAMHRKREIERQMNISKDELQVLVEQHRAVCDGIHQLKARGVSL